MTNALDSTEVGRPAGTGVLVATCVSTLVVNANTSAVTILLPAIAEDVNASVSTLQWAVTGYSLVGAAFIVTSGALGDVFGRRKVFLGGLLLFIGSCALIALSDTQVGVIGGRCIQGAAGCTILASGLSLLTVASSGSERLRAVSLWGAASAVGAAAGPLVGGLLVDSTGWQGLFWIDAAIAACLHSRDAEIDRGIPRSEPPAFDRLVRHGAGGHDPCSVDLGGDEGIRVGMDLGGNPPVPAGLDPLGDRLRRGRAPIAGTTGRSAAHAQQAVDRRNARHPDRRRDHQRFDVRGQPVLPESRRHSA